MRTAITVMLVLASLAAVGCMPPSRAQTPTPIMSPPPPPAPDPMDNPGSLYNPDQSDYLFADNRARRVGDIVLVTVSEVTNAEHKANTKAERNTELNFGVENYAVDRVIGSMPFPNPFGMAGVAGGNPAIKAGAQNNFKGTAETKRESTVTATVAVRVVQVLPGNVFQVEGAREVRVNDETQIMVVRGLVRKRDIGPDNSVSSSYLADARIELYGQGVLADKQRPGWLSRILDNVWPF
ncbi:MAG: flagellar basal body L-ring protein FlgH [Desulfovibrionaceae bacterium]